MAQMLTCMDDLSAPPPSAHQDPTSDPATANLVNPLETEAQQEATPSKHVVIIGKLWLTDWKLYQTSFPPTCYADDADTDA